MPGSDDLIPSSEASTALWRRRIGLKHLTTITISIGVIGSVAMVAALLLGLWLLVRMRRRRRDTSSHPAKSDVGLNTFPSKERPYPRNPQSDLRRLDVELDSEQSPVENSIRSPSNPISRPKTVLDGNRGGSSTTPAPSRKLSRQKMIPGGTIPPSELSRSPRQINTFEQNTSIPTAPIPAFTQPPSQVEPTPGTPASKPSVRRLPPIPQPPQAPKRSPSPTIIRPLPQPQPDSIIPRPRGSSLPGSRPRPNITVDVPPPTHHVTSASEDSAGPSSRFSVSPVSRSFSSRLPFAGSSPPSSKKFSSTTPTLLSQANRFGSLPNLVPLKSDNTGSFR
ncbi:hypothetical protein MSAN_01379800 [Mycena sanguinolenta]|uniref:Uncharacterized protein n=1 Tax=Mycena sanguinolenta TaxID=230812 RepID=A0A8H6Y9J6_9AGAR|nr:hypothetical protein MSAN_01379800 [Mycena sanguinolenta]